MERWFILRLNITYYSRISYNYPLFIDYSTSHIDNKIEQEWQLAII